MANSVPLSCFKVTTTPELGSARRAEIGHLNCLSHSLSGRLGGASGLSISFAGLFKSVQLKMGIVRLSSSTSAPELCSLLFAAAAWTRPLVASAQSAISCLARVCLSAGGLLLGSLMLLLALLELPLVCLTMAATCCLHLAAALEFAPP